MKPAPPGFSLVELLVVLAISAIMLTAALPDFRQSIQRYRLNAVVSDFFGALELARSQAIARGGRVVVAPAAGDGAAWRAGWTVFADGDGDGSHGPGDVLIATQGAIAEGVAIDLAFTGGQDYIAFNSAGRSCSAASSLAARWGTITITHNDQIRRIKINMLGRARVCDPARDGASCAGPAGAD